MRKLLVTAGIGSLAFLLSSCFVLQGFSIGKGALSPGQSTKINMTVHPWLASGNPFSRAYQFVLVGVDTPADLGVGGATWGTNHKFGGPKPMVVQANLYSTLGTACDGTGFSLSALSSNTWKGFVTQTPIKDKQLIATSVKISVGLNAKGGAASGDYVQVVGVTGIWQDATGDGLTGDDTFGCTGNGSGAVTII